MKRARRPIETTRIDTAHARAQLTLLLVNAPDDKVAGFTVDSLSRMNRSPRRYIAERLSVEQARRAARG